MSIKALRPVGKKSILVVLIVLLAFTVWTVLAFGKAKKEEGVQQPTEIQKAEPSPAPEDFPEVVLPKAKPTRPTTEDYQNLLLEKKGMTPEMWEMRQPQELEVPDIVMKELLSPDSCILGNQQAPCCYWNGAVGSHDLACWGWLSLATFIDPDDQGAGMDPCPYPILPFEATHVMWQVYTADACTLKFMPQIREVVYLDGCPYPGDVIATGPIYEIYHEGGWFTGYLALDPSVCLYGEFFNVMVFTNSDDFWDTTYCDPIYGAQGSAMEWCPSPVFDISGRVCQSYWGPYTEYPGDPYYGWFDVVPNGLWSGALRIWTMGYNAGQNECPPPDTTWYFKDPYEPAAPCGIPDFDQYQMPGPAFCGPTAGANSIWWFASRGDFPPSPALIEEIAALAGTDPNLGTECDSLEEAIIQTIYKHGGWWFEETTVYAPDFWYLQKELRACEDVVLLLGFWQEDPPGSGNWYRFGGHFVSLAGIDIYNLAFAFSDPAMDAAEFGMSAGVVCGTHNPANDPFDHNTGPTSYDFRYIAWPSESPGGFLWLPEYMANWPDFQDQNAGPWPNDGVYNDQLPVFVEVEQAIVVSPGSKEMSGEIESSHAYEVDNNHGGIAESFQVDFGAGYVEGGYYGSFIVGTEQADLNCDYGDYYPVETFDALASPVLDSFVVAGAAGDYKIYQLTLNFAHKFIPDLDITEYVFGFWVPQGGVENCEYVIEHVFVLHNTGETDIIGLQTGVINDYDIGENNACDIDFDQQHQSVWMWETTVPGEVFGMTKKPAVAGDVAITGWGLKNDGRIYDGEYHDSLKYWMENLGWGVDEPGVFDDKSLLIADSSFDLPAGGYHIEKWLKWGYGDTISTGGDSTWRHFLYDVLHQEGYYRGDVNKDRMLSIADAIYLVNYLLKFGTEPHEFVDQGDVNCDGKVTVSDIICLVNFLLKGGAAPIDKNRFLMKSPFVDPAHKALAERNPGLFGDLDWLDLGQ